MQQLFFFPFITKVQLFTSDDPANDQHQTPVGQSQLWLTKLHSLRSNVATGQSQLDAGYEWKTQLMSFKLSDCTISNGLCTNWLVYLTSQTLYIKHHQHQQYSMQTCRSSTLTFTQEVSYSLESVSVKPPCTLR